MSLLLIFLYVLPAIIALGRRHSSAGAIVVIDLFLGWTLVGWFWALIWSLSTARAIVVMAAPAINNSTNVNIGTIPSPATVTNPDTLPGMKICEFCESVISKTARVCRFCQRDVLVPTEIGIPAIEPPRQGTYIPPLPPAQP